MINSPGFCVSCGEACMQCRDSCYSGGKDIVSAFEPLNPDPSRDSFYPIDEINQAIPEIPNADIVLAINVRADTLLFMLPRFKEIGIKGIVGCSEITSEIFPDSWKNIEKKAAELGIEVAFSKPFCALRLDASKPNIARFLQRTRIGEPEIEIGLQKGKDGNDFIAEAKVKRSAPCGSTWFIARCLIGLSSDQTNLQEKISQALYEYPCTASKDFDPEIGDDVKGKAELIACEAVTNGIKNAKKERKQNNWCINLFKDKLEYFIIIICFGLLLYVLEVTTPSKLELSIAISSYFLTYGIFMGKLISNKEILYPCIPGRYSKLPTTISQLENRDFINIFFGLVSLLVLSEIFILYLKKFRAVNAIIDTQAFLYDITWLIIFYLILNTIVLFVIKKDISCVKINWNKIGIFVTIISFLFAAFVPLPMVDIFGSLFHLEIRGMPNQVNCVPGYDKAFNITVDEGYCWPALKKIGLGYILMADNNNYIDVSINNHETQLNEYMICINVRNSSGIYNNKHTFPIYLSSDLPFKLPNPQNININIIYFNISFNPTEKVVTCKNTSISRDVIGNIMSPDIFVNLRAKSNITGVKIKFDPPKINYQQSKSKMIICIDANTKLGKYEIPVIGEYEDKEPAVCNLSLTINDPGIYGKIFNDRNRNGRKDMDDEEGLLGWIASLTRIKDNHTEKTAAAEDGSYVFRNIEPGTYKLIDTTRTGWTATVPANGTYIITLNNTDVTDKNFGNRLCTASISGIAFVDENRDGVKGPNEQGSSNCVIFLDKPDRHQIFANTNSEGLYEFENLEPGRYRVSEKLDEGWRQTVPLTGYYDVELSNKDEENRNFGKWQKMYSISGIVFNDENRDGVRGPNEQGSSNCAILLDKPDSHQIFANTNSEGLYEFENLEPGRYRVSEKLDEGWRQTVPLTGYYDVELSDKDEENRNFGKWQKMYSISGIAFNDENRDGVKGPNEQGSADCVILLDKPDSHQMIADTNSEGLYEFENLEPGRYRVSEKLDEGWRQTVPLTGYYDVELSDKDEENRNFGKWQSGIASNGENRDGVKGPNDYITSDEFKEEIKDEPIDYNYALRDVLKENGWYAEKNDIERSIKRSIDYNLNTNKFSYKIKIILDSSNRPIEVRFGKMNPLNGTYASADEILVGAANEALTNIPYEN